MKLTMQHADLLESPYPVPVVQMVNTILATARSERRRHEVALYLIRISLFGLGPMKRIKYRQSKRLEAYIAKNIEFFETKTDELIAVCHALSTTQGN